MWMRLWINVLKNFQRDLCRFSALRFKHHWAVFDAIAAPGTKIHINTASTLSNLHLEIALLTGNALHF
jgi:hypothetical protein